MPCEQVVCLDGKSCPQMRPKMMQGDRATYFGAHSAELLSSGSAQNA
jgi:hypothetical protein